MTGRVLTAIRQCQNGECNGNGFGSLSGEFLNKLNFLLWVSSINRPESRIISFWFVSQRGLPTNGYHRNNPPGLPQISLDNRPISHSHREGPQGAVLWLVDQWFSDSRPCAKLGDTNLNCPPSEKYIFLFMLWNPMTLLTDLARCADVYFLVTEL